MPFHQYGSDSGIIEMYDSRINMLIQKSYQVIRKQEKQDIYTGPIQPFVYYWFKHNPDSNHVHITIYGSWHATFPNEPHLTVEFKTPYMSSGRLHIAPAYDETLNHYYLYELPIAGINKKRKRKKSKNSKKRKYKKLQTLKKRK